MTMEKDNYFQGPVAALGKAQVDIATLQAEVKHLTNAVDDLTESNDRMTAQLQEIRDLLNQASGGWKAMMFLGGAAASFGAFIVWALEHITIK